jgi:nitroreductase
VPDNALFQTRFSCREFGPEPVPAPVIDALLDAARWAPSAGNVQATRFVVVTRREARERLAEAAFGQRFLAEAPVIFVVCALPEVSARQYGERGRELYCIQDAAAAAENMLLSATLHGLGSCWVGAFRERDVAKALGLQRGWRPVALLPVGRARRGPSQRCRLPLSTLTLRVD